MKKILALFGALAALSLSACETISYYGQAVAGQLYILAHREEIEHLIDNERVDEETREKLNRILEIRAFAEAELGLPVRDSFSTYVDLKRPYVVWNVFATPEFSMKPVNWCYPIAGCVSYRGYFNEGSAQKFARTLQGNGYDVHTGGVAAYSTLGWFSDPLLNTVLRREDHQLASLIFHELAHQVVYVKGDTEFNESFATAVEQEGLRRWLAKTGRSDEEGQRILDSIQEAQAMREDFVQLVQDTVRDLQRLYRSDLDPEEKRAGKERLFAEMKDDYRDFKKRWKNHAGYDAWFRDGLNNAKLSTVATYFAHVPAFQAMLAEEGGDLQAFYRRVRALGQLDRSARQAYLETRPARQVLTES